MYRALTLLSLFGILTFLGILADAEFVYKCPANFTMPLDDVDTQCYHFLTEEISSDDAHAICDSMGSDFLVFAGTEENTNATSFRFVCVTSIISELSCPDGWILNPQDTEINACYQLVKTPTNYENASIVCQETPGAVLYTPTSDAENDFIINQMGENFLIGLTDAETEGTFLTTTGELQTYENWCFWFFEPNDLLWFGPENCVMVWTEGFLNGCQNDVRCDRIYPFVCKLG